jgi:DNA-binding transcriptional ArsR family regulator
MTLTETASSCRKPLLMPDLPERAGGDVFAAIASPLRRALLDTLAAGPLPVRDIAAGFPVSRPAVSQQLRILKAAALVREERAGRERRYHLNPAPLRDVEVWLTHYERFWQGRLGALREVLDGEQ